MRTASYIHMCCLHRKAYMYAGSFFIHKIVDRCQSSKKLCPPLALFFCTFSLFYLFNTPLPISSQVLSCIWKCRHSYCCNASNTLLMPACTLCVYLEDKNISVIHLLYLCKSSNKTVEEYWKYFIKCKKWRISDFFFILLGYNYWCILVFISLW